ncbi:MFS transporter [Sulfolobus acidocaldarius]|uniref:ABC transporter permease n=3 Tax=Sulfolobus acidocaldarius TaxID=2285 RepID=A0A0U3HAV7_9CREN|nr:MFS transporter [Sulfolobus acidocaldarius]AGE70209.1 hypothetical protein SacN8_01140 [Sulfolobus acidocaldarius N8]AGE72484.1 hypothetical protein SacRon12I_01140 [Sulfolobus acidocaldarius Ron12/I]ALU29382.1 ABC transporter permease [Sulfolobus acidocaldarius]ALU32111.1 ABC transporter permease [Sulfolobus acidocaldarius]WCM34227.1 MFS transporter [Sulfolobus acidocaldarius DSM 639]
MNKWVIVFITSSSFFLGYFARVAWSIVSVYSTLKPNEFENGLIFSLFFIAYVIVQIPSGLLSDIFKPNLIALLSLIGLFVSSLLSGIAQTILMLYISSFMMGFCAGWIYPVTIKILTATFSKNELNKAISYYSLAWPLSIVISGLALPAMTIDLGWRAPYYMIALISLVLGLSYLKLGNVKKDLDNKNNNKLSFSVIKDRRVLVVSVAGFLFFLSYWTIALYAYKYFLYTGLNDYFAGLAYSLLALTGIPSTIMAGFIIQRFGPIKSLSLFEGVYGILTIILPISLNYIYILIIAAVMGFVRFVITPANSSAVAMIGGNKAGSVSGISNFFWQTSGIISPILASFILVDFSYLALWIFCGLVILVSAIMYYVLL